MATLLQTATGFEDLLRVEDPAGVFRYDRIFEGEGWAARRCHKGRLILLRSLERELGSLLEPGEQVEHVTRGLEYSFVDAQLLGLWHLLLNQRALVLTDRRLLLLQTDLRARPKGLKSQIRREAIDRVRAGRLGMGRLTFRTRDGRDLMLSGVPRPDRRVLRERLSAPDSATAAGVSAARGREHLCPHCHAPAAEVGGAWPERCPHCRGEFKASARAGWLSLAFPGLGDLYLGNRVLGAFEITVALMLWVGLVPVLALAALGNAGRAGFPWLALGLGGSFFAMIHGANALVTRHVARKGLYPARAGGSAPTGP